MILNLLFTRRKSQEKRTVKTRGSPAAAAPHSTPKKNEEQSESGWRKKMYCSNTKCRSRVSSSSEEKGKGILQNRQFQTKLLLPNWWKTIPETELILSLDELDDSQPKASSHRKRAVESVSEMSEEKEPRVEEGIALIVILHLPILCYHPIINRRNSCDYRRQPRNHKFYLIVD